MLEELEKYAQEHRIPIMMKDGIDYLCNLIQEHQITKILEIGSAIGYSAIKMASVSPNIQITTIEKDSERYKIAINNIQNFNLQHQITILNEDALESNLTEKYDLIFIDASKGHNIDFFEKYKDNLSPKGLIVTDNLSFHGLVEDEQLIKTKNQRGIVKKIQNYLNFLDTNKDFITTYVPVGDRISISQRKNKVIIIPASQEQLLECSNHQVDGVLISISKLSVNGNFYLTISELIALLPQLKNLEICISLNKIMHNNDIELLTPTLFQLEKLNISKIFFYDLSILNIVKKNKLNLNLVISQEHLNASTYSNLFFQKRQVKATHITNDITIDEILEIKQNTNLEIYYTVFGYLPIFYSRRYLIKNYFEHIQQDKTSNTYYLNLNEDYYPIVEEEYGTTIYTNQPINLLSEVSRLLPLDYLLLNAYSINEDQFWQITKKFQQNIPDSVNHYTGFANLKTIYKVKNDEKK